MTFCPPLRNAIGTFAIAASFGLDFIRADSCGSDNDTDECDTTAPSTSSSFASDPNSEAESTGSWNNFSPSPTATLMSTIISPTSSLDAVVVSSVDSDTSNSSSATSDSNSTATSDSYSSAASNSDSSQTYTPSSIYDTPSSPYDEDTSSSSANETVIAIAMLVVFVGIIVSLTLLFVHCKQKRSARKVERDYQSLFTPINVNRNDKAPSPGTPPADMSGLWTDPVIAVFRIPREKVIMGTLVSQGGYGEVYRGTYKDQQVAIKILHPALRSDVKQINSFLQEAKIMASIEHKRLVPFIGVAWDSLRDLCVVTQFMEGGDLRSLLKQFDNAKSRSQGFDVDKIKIAMHVAHALSYLHSLRPVVIHRDLKSRNILLDAKWNAKLTDFGVSRETSDQTMTAGIGTTLWMAPEVMMGERYDEKADIFSFGVVLTELDSHQLPYTGAKHSESGRTLPDTAILQRVAMGQLKAEFSESAPEWLRELGSSCLSLDPRDRPIAAQLLYVLQTKC